MTGLLACNQIGKDRPALENRVDSLKNLLANTYKPGLGEFMTGIQLHHAKLWFAGQNQNWALADFEVHEIEEAIEDINVFNKDRPEVKFIGMINPVLDSVNNAIQQKDHALFNKRFVLLTNTCNDCHKATAHEFNVVITPTALPVVNQDFKPGN